MKDMQDNQALTTAKEQLPFNQQLLIRIEDLKNGSYTLQAVNNTGLITPPGKLAAKLFFRHEPSYFGLRASVGDLAVHVTSCELVELLSPTYRHPFIQLKGIDEESMNAIHHFEAAAKVWDQGEFWQDVTIKDDQVEFAPHYGTIIQKAVEQKLQSIQLDSHLLPSLLPYFQNGGWPIQTNHSIADIQVGLRLSEPDENAEDWTLETVIINKRTGSVWTPSVRKRLLPLELALPEKWVAHSSGIESIQQQLITLLQAESSENGTIHRDNLEHEKEHDSIQVYSPFNRLSAINFIHTPLTDTEVKSFLQHTLAVIQSFGFEVLLPAWLKELKQSKMRVRVSAGQSNSKSMAGLDDILSFKWQFSLNNEEISADQFKKIVDEKREFIRIGNEWFRIDANWLMQMKQLMAQAEEENWTVRELLFKELPEELVAPPEEDEDDAMRDDPLFAFEIHRSLQQYVEQLSDKKGLPSLPTPTALQAELRPYQQEGFEWLAFMRQQGFGACLADDMGLGKTIQLITYILYTIETLDNKKTSLIICPTSVLGNWQKELERFAPSIRVHTHYGSNRLKDETFHTLLESKEKPQLILTTYGTVTQDIPFLQDVQWNVIGLDEAQNIKNMQTMQSKSIRKLKGDHHIALTGTPVENRLSELWAIFDFIHKGYLGSFTKFQEKFITPIERDDSAKHKHSLQMKIRPFLMRRTKRDPALQLNLPEKQESQEFCPLTTEQAALYEGYIADTMERLEQMTPFEKRGHILKMLNKLKQLCNHPALFLKEPFESAETMMKRSIKVQRLVTMSKEIIENGEQCLIFTQYIGMGNLLQHIFSELYDVDVPFLTGSMTKQQRDRLVEAFQAGEFPIFILSLKAGGTGLNLTAANHVLHADRWWNPAVENQATDRAYRIGQKHFVQVHKFVTLGTIEEKIDKMLEAKSALSEELIQSSKWITELDDAELRELLTLDV